MRIFTFLIACILVPVPSPPARNELPQIAMQSNWGTVTQVGASVSVNGHAEWRASGRIRQDGKLALDWTHLPDGRAGLSLYDTSDTKSLRGKWGWTDKVRFGEDGELIGLPPNTPESDRIYEVKK